MRRRKNIKKNMLYIAKRPTSMLEKINSNNTIESRKKRVQLATLFYILSESRPMAEFSSRLALYELLVVPDLPNMH